MAGTRRGTLVLLIVVAVLCLRQAQAAGPKLNVSSYVMSPLWAQITTNPPPVNCTALGTCKPAANQTVPAYTVWVWCGFSSTHRSNYIIGVNNNRTLACSIMRSSEFYGCAAKNFSQMQSCQFIAGSNCDAKTKCNVRTFGLAMYDEICLICGNNANVSKAFSVQYISSFDYPRSVGVPILITMFACFCIVILLIFFFNIKREVMKPVVSKEQPISSANEVAKFEGPVAPPPQPPTFKTRLQNSLRRVLTLGRGEEHNSSAPLSH